MTKSVQLDFSFWGFDSAKKTVADAERAVRAFFKAGGTSEDLLAQLNAYFRKNEDEAYRLLTDKKGVPVALAIEDYSGCCLPAASALARSGNLKVLTHAVLRGADLERSGKDHSPAIVAAAESCWERDDNASLPHRDALRRGFYADVVPLLQFLLEQGADINATDGEGRTALHHAARVGHQSAVEFLLRNGAEVWRQDASGDTALHQAVIASQWVAGYGSYCDVVGTVRTLLAHGAKPNHRNFAAHTPMFSIAVNGEDLSRTQFDQIVGMLLEAGADLEAKDRYGVTPFLRSMRNDDGDRILIPGFIDAGADTEAKTPQGSGAGRLGSEAAKRALKAALMAKNIDAAMSGPSGGKAPGRAGAKRDTFGVL